MTKKTNTFETRFKIALALVAIATFVWTYVACNDQDDMSSKGNNIVKEQSETEMQPTRVYDLKERSIPHNLFGQEAKEACEQNDKRFSPVYDTKTDTCHLTVKEPTVQTRLNIRRLLKHCVLHHDINNHALEPRKTITGVCGIDKQHGYKTEVLFKDVKSFKQDLMEQCSKMNNCTCDKNANCALIINDHVLADPQHPGKYLGSNAWKCFDFSKWGFIATLTEEIENNKYQVGFSPLPLKVIYTNVEPVHYNQHNRCRLQCFKTDGMDGTERVLKGMHECICKPLLKDNRQH